MTDSRILLLVFIKNAMKTTRPISGPFSPDRREDRDAHVLIMVGRKITKEE